MPAPNADEGSAATPRGGDFLTLAVSGMRCDNCAASIAKRLDALPGVAEARVSYALEDARIRFDPNQRSTESLIAEIEAAGYHASIPAFVGGRETQPRSLIGKQRRLPTSDGALG